jgi:hypothetical protein
MKLHIGSGPNLVIFCFETEEEYRDWKMLQDWSYEETKRRLRKTHPLKWKNHGLPMIDSMHDMLGIPRREDKSPYWCIDCQMPLGAIERGEKSLLPYVDHTPDHRVGSVAGLCQFEHHHMRSYGFYEASDGRCARCDVLNPNDGLGWRTGP